LFIPKCLSDLSRRDMKKAFGRHPDIIPVLYHRVFACMQLSNVTAANEFEIGYC
jgi:hypothetical protein